MKTTKAFYFNLNQNHQFKIFPQMRQLFFFDETHHWQKGLENEIEGKRGNFMNKSQIDFKNNYPKFVLESDGRRGLEEGGWAWL